MSRGRLARCADEDNSSSRHVTTPCPTIFPFTFVKNASQLAPGIKPLDVVRAEVVQKRLPIGCR